MTNDDSNTYAKGLRICAYQTRRGYGGFVEGTRQDDYLYGFTSARDPMTNSLQLAHIVDQVRRGRG